MLIRFATTLFLMLQLFGCVHSSRALQHDAALVPDLVSTIETQVQQRQRVSGKFSANATGIKQFLGRVDVTMALQKPASFYFSIPSFFGMAARVVSSDGERFYMLDMTGQGPTFLTRPSDAETMEAWLGLPISPRAFVYALLACVDLEGASPVDAFKSPHEQTLGLRLRTASGEEKVVVFNDKTHDLLSQSVSMGTETQYSITYADYRDTAIGRFPWRVQIALSKQKESIEIVFKGQELDFSLEPYDLSTFQIEEP